MTPQVRSKTDGTQPAGPPRWSVLRRVLHFFVFIACFLRALVAANLEIAKHVLFTKTRDLAPGFIDYPLDDLSDFEVIVLSHCITLTPGTTSVELSRQDRRILVHAFDARDPEGTVADIKRQLEAPLLRWTRSSRAG